MPPRIFDFASRFSCRTKAREVFDGPQSTVTGQIDSYTRRLLECRCQNTDDEVGGRRCLLLHFAVSFASNARDKDGLTISQAVQSARLVTFHRWGILSRAID